MIDRDRSHGKKKPCPDGFASWNPADGMNALPA
jgi:hypothetical protein